MLPIRLLIAASLLALAPIPGLASDAIASLEGTGGEDVGTVSLTPTASGSVRITISVTGLEPGVHAIHIHERGDCSATDFSSAGGHLALGRDHGVASTGGPHPGDLPNLHVGTSGMLTVEYFADAFSLDATAANTLFDIDGSAIVIHAGADDYSSQPSGAAGGRIACGAIHIK